MSPLSLLSLLLLTFMLISPTLSLTTQDLNYLTAFANETDMAAFSEEDEVLLERETGMDRRSLYWKRHYYISYGALAANRIPCPARSGRSYYTHNCYKARGPVHPYSRGCSAITRCRR